MCENIAEKTNKAPLCSVKDNQIKIEKLLKQSLAFGSASGSASWLGNWH